MRTGVQLLGLGVVVTLVARALDRAGLPAPALFAGLLVGLLTALLVERPVRLPPASHTVALAVIGVAVGVTVQPAALAGLTAHWLPILLITVATLGLSMAAGPLLARWTGLDRVTAALGMISGGAAGITALSDDLGADARIVAVLQYLRVLLVVLLMPLAVVVLFDGEGGTDVRALPASDVPLALAAVAVLGAVGTWAGRLVALPSPAVLGPLLLTAPLAALDVPGTDAVPALLGAVAFALLGAHVGLRFTPDTVRTVRRILPVVVGLVLAVIVGNAALGLLLSALTGIEPLDGYLATTPGGLYVVLAVAAGSHADATVVLAVQVLRLVVMLVAAPPLTRLLLRSR